MYVMNKVDTIAREAILSSFAAYLAANAYTIPARGIVPPFTA
jgi:hypothetical protein